MEIVVGLRAAQHSPGRGASLLITVVPVLDAQATEVRVQMVCHVARRIDVTQRGAAAFVHEHAVVDRRSCGCQQLAAGRDPDSCDHQLALEEPPFLGAHPLDLSGAFKPGHGILHHQFHALLAMDPGQHFADLRTEDSGQRHRVALDGGYLKPKLTQRCRHLRADEAEADHDSPAAGPRNGTNPVAVLDRAQLKNALQIRPGDRERSVAPAGSHEQLVVRDLLAAIQPDDLPCGVDVGRTDPEPQVDTLLGVRARGVDELVFESLLAAEITLRQGRTVVRELGFGTNDLELTVETAVPEARCRSRACQAGADDCDTPATHCLLRALAGVTSPVDPGFEWTSLLPLSSQCLPIALCSPALLGLQPRWAPSKCFLLSAVVPAKPGVTWPGPSAMPCKCGNLSLHNAN